ncbi:MAG: LysR family transcriptional regulator [Porphyrobacter sp.]|nr:LysR family transcriptional regulator [Porphyrobacter sp.]
MTQTQPRSPAPQPRSHADYRWTRDKMLAFLHAFAASGKVAEAARSVGMSRQSAYRLRARLGPQFGEVWETTRKLGVMARQGDTFRRPGAAR